MVSFFPCSFRRGVSYDQLIEGSIVGGLIIQDHTMY